MRVPEIILLTNGWPQHVINKDKNKSLSFNASKLITATQMTSYFGEKSKIIIRGMLNNYVSNDI